MYGQLGDIIFEGLYGPESFERKDSISVPLHGRIGRRPKIQFTGIDLATVQIGIHIHRSFINVEQAILKFREYRNTVKQLRYITGSGNVIGTFIITDTKQTHAQETPQGDIVSAKLELTLLETNASQPKVAAVNNAIANSANNPALVPLTPIVPSIPVSAALDVSIARGEAVASATTIYTTASNPTPPADTQSKFEQARERVATARDHMARAASKVQAASETAQQAQAYVANMYTAAQNAQTLIDMIDAFDPLDPVGSINNVVNVNSQFMASVSVMTNTSQPLAAFTGSRRWQ